MYYDEIDQYVDRFYREKEEAQASSQPEEPAEIEEGLLAFYLYWLDHAEDEEPPVLPGR